MIDEAEQHLSYDAQASLVGVLETQTLVQKVIYTTHSAGCLPSDLGTGVRPITSADDNQSIVSNGFWSAGPGFSPLMLAMGLTTLAFTPARNVVICEGASECILLPTLLRQAVERKQLGYQIAPGASLAANNQLGELSAEAGRVVFLVDGDDAGEKIEQRLHKSGTPVSKTNNLGRLSRLPLVFEDLIDEESYVTAFNSELKRWQNTGLALATTDLPKTGRASAVDIWCKANNLKPVTKSTLCQAIAELGANGQAVVRKGLENVLADIDRWCTAQFSLVVTSNPGNSPEGTTSSNETTSPGIASTRLELAKLRTYGVEIRNAAVNYIDSSAWESEIAEWAQRATNTIAQIDSADAEWFRTLDAVPSARVGHNSNATSQMEKNFREHDFRLRKLEQLIDRYSQQSSPDKRSAI